jgi:hypothetical protein
VLLGYRDRRRLSRVPVPMPGAGRGAARVPRALIHLLTLQRVGRGRMRRRAFSRVVADWSETRAVFSFVGRLGLSRVAVTNPADLVKDIEVTAEEVSFMLRDHQRNPLF